jgi:hypothetical protein
MSQIYPLTEQLWLEWLKDEQKFVHESEDRKRVIELFQRAMQDYLSVDLWLEYIQFSIGGMGEPNGIENVRLICEQALKVAGLHVKKGYALWEVYREFEGALLAGYQHSCSGSVQTEQQTKQINDQIERINRIFCLQLNTCLDNLSNTIEEFKQFDEINENKTKSGEEMKQIYEKTLTKYLQIEPFEEALVNNIIY